MLELVKLNEENYGLVVDMMDEWSAAKEKIIPHAIGKADYRDYDAYLRSLEAEPGEGKVPATTYFCMDTERGIMVGAVNIRHYLNESLAFDGGHIGDGIRPSERGKGLGTQMISLALDKCREMNLRNVLMVCDKSNKASAATIVKNGGVLENEIEVDGKPEQRYWIAL